MTTTGERPQAPETNEPEVMKSLVLGIVGDLGRLLKEHGLGHKPIRILEAIIFAMFVVTEAFVSVKKGLDQAQESLDLFHEDMTEYIFKEYLFKHQKAQDMEELNAHFNQFRELINQRYQEYRQNFLEDYQDQQLGFRRTFTALLSHLLQEPLPEGEEQDRLISVFSVKLAHFWSGCMSSFQPGSG
jgi:arsenate reductase-like glutaredoxin family protein